MEFRRYLDILRAHWEVFVLAFAITAGLTAFLAIQQDWVYEAEGTYVVRPRTVQADEIVRAFDTLNRGVEINATFAAIAESDLVKRRARDAIEGPTGGLSINADVVAGTNMIEIAVRGTDPERVYAFAVAAGAETQKYVSELADAFVLAQLDPPSQPSQPVGPNKALTIIVGSVFGLLLGASLAVVVDYLGEATGRPTSFNVIDPPTGAFNSDYFSMRLREESARVAGTGRTFSVAQIRIRTRDELPQVPEPRVLREIVDSITPATRPQDVVGATEPGTLSILFPDLPTDACETLLENWKLMIEMGSEPALKVSTSVEAHGSGSKVERSQPGVQTEQPQAWV